MKRRLAAALVAILAIQPVAAFAQCHIYQHRDYGGSRWTVGSNTILYMKNNPNPGFSSTTNGHGIDPEYNKSWNDQLSSFKVAPGCTITLWKNHDAKGDRWEANSNYSYVGGKWNDEASTVMCSCRR
ncbi:hypothetical protein [Devosia sp. 63-57]|uniref:hypothetical protein n=1 Tax=Devosia sp. 63-57 TaxID=1895751 RepID=UPI00086926A3|nr:hypothetical protein [Devosia sp. 63-57]ODT48205.1 MAG: hypothetical protein ABS74_18725 [Pelagibacterium sp. SCN 63-126]ODU85343.1 MAG: hypothetical protein ABT14_12835 [Pelagibacterium sp. SCN 63-17]OJX42085.1 MAG: hypothetical protein BGO80_11125 [Devosia sp. 63-57]